MPHRAGLDRTKVIEAAAKLVDEEGIDQLSLGRLAERLGVRTPSLYSHIPTGQAGLKHYLALYSLHDLRDRITRATIGKSRREAIFAFADAYRAFAKEAPGRYILTQQAPDPDDEDLQAIAGQIIDVVGAILAPYKLSDDETIHAIRSLRSIVHGFISLEAMGGFKIALDLDASFHWLIALFVDGLEHAAESPSSGTEPG
jgi:AcrR family transcriptional regulator